MLCLFSFPDRFANGNVLGHINSALGVDLAMHKSRHGEALADMNCTVIPPNGGGSFNRHFLLHPGASGT
jgi:hypothetical protein